MSGVTGKDGTRYERTPVDALVAKRLGLREPLVRHDLEKAQLALLRQTIDHARSGSPLYRRRLVEVEIDSLQAETDLERIPLLTAADLATEGSQLLAVSLSQVARVVTLQTSGSTGEPKRLSYSTDDLRATREFFWYGIKSLIGSDDRVLVLLPWEVPDGVGDLLIRVLLEKGVHAEGLWPPLDPAETAAIIEERQLSCVVGLPQHLLALSISLQPGLVRSMLLCSDYAPPTLRRRIEKGCGCETFLHYGSTESGLGGAVECRLHNGCHLRESDLLVEIINPVSGLRMPEGERGEVVITTLGRRAMPLIRYRTGDLGRLERSPCGCGGITARLLDIGGRMRGVSLASGELLFARDLDDTLYEAAGLLDYRAALDRVGDSDRLQLEVVAVPGTRGLEDEVRRLLLQMACIRDSVALEKLVVGAVRQVDRFTATHTVKRTILDQR